MSVSASSDFASNAATRAWPSAAAARVVAVAHVVRLALRDRHQHGRADEDDDEDTRRPARPGG